MRVVGLVIRPPVSTLAPSLAPGRSQAAPEVLGAGSITTILGAPDIYFRPGPGTLVNITCVVSSLKRPEHIFWYHNGQVSEIGLQHVNDNPVTSFCIYHSHVTLSEEATRRDNCVIFPVFIKCCQTVSLSSIIVSGHNLQVIQSGL